MDKEKKTIEVMDTKSLSSCVDLLKGFLDKGVKNGMYDLQETQQILMCLSGLTNSVNLLDKYQTLVSSQVNSQKNNPEITSNRD